MCKSLHYKFNSYPVGNTFLRFFNYNVGLLIAFTQYSLHYLLIGQFMAFFISQYNNFILVSFIKIFLLRATRVCFASYHIHFFISLKNINYVL